MKNQITTIGKLARQTGACTQESYFESIEAFRILQKHMPTETENGRMSYGIVQQLICIASGGMIQYGGQGRNDPDWTYEGKWGETKSFRRDSDITHVAASSFFAKNSKVPEHRGFCLSIHTTKTTFIV